MPTTFELQGNYVDMHNRKIFYATITISEGTIQSVQALEQGEKAGEPYILPGFVDSHVHIESSMLVPAEFARLAVVHGTVATISDPHEIANVCGKQGVEYMIENGKTVPFKFHFGAPSCVPATVFETAGDTLDAEAVKELLHNPDIYYLSEMMNFPGVLMKDEAVMQKIQYAVEAGKPVDGHAPGLRGENARQYIAAGISTDHECFTADEALDKLKYGMKILIREGSAAKNFEALIPLLDDYHEHIMFCSDDKHPDSLVAGHINQLCARAVAKGHDVFKVLQAACINPVQHYNMRVGLLQPGDAADFIMVHNLQDFEVKATYINGTLVAENGISKIVTTQAAIINRFNCTAKSATDFAMPVNGKTTVDVIEAIDGQLITNRLQYPVTEQNGLLVSNVATDVLKIAVVNRYFDAPVAMGFIKNIGIQQGALASSVAHDSHNIVAVGVDDESLALAINLVIEQQGGVSAVGKGKQLVLPLPVAGIMSNQPGYAVADAYTAIDSFAKELGSRLSAPFMTLSFMALLVIPHLKLSDKGMFDGDSFSFL